MDKTKSGLGTATHLITAGLVFGITWGCSTAPERKKVQQAPNSLTGRSSKQNASNPSSSAQANEATGTPSAQEMAELKEIQRLYGSAQYEDVIQKLILFEKRYPASPQLPQARNLHGLSFFLTKRPLQAVYHFRKSVDSTPAGNVFRHYVLYNLASAQFELNQIDESLKTLNEIEISNLDNENRVKFHFLKTRLYQKKNLPIEAARESLSSSMLLQDSQARGPFVSQLDQVLSEVSDPAALEQLLKDFETSPLADLVLYRLGSQEIALGRILNGETHLRDLLSKYPNSTKYADATDILKSSQNRNLVDGNAIGMIVPLKGKWAKIGNKAIQGIELALRVFNANEPASPLTLVVEDSGEDPEQAVKALNKLFFKHHVIAAIGPLMSKGVDQVTQRAQELGLPLLTLSQQPGTMGDYIFQSGLTPRLQAQEIARYAIEKRGMKKFAILAPKDKFGDQYSQTFWDSVEALGGKIVGIEYYTPGETDFRQPIDKLAGLYYSEARQKELDQLAKEREENKIKKRTRKTEKYFSLTPIVHFDAVFVPDEPKIVGQILPTFAYRDIDKVEFLGIAAWNSPELIERAQTYAESSAFVDAFFQGSTLPNVVHFVDRFKLTFQQDPGALEALAYDAAKILEQAVVSSSTRTREEVKNQLRSVRQFSGVTGKISFKEGQLARDLNILSVKQGKIVEISQF